MYIELQDWCFNTQVDLIKTQINSTLNFKKLHLYYTYLKISLQQWKIGDIHIP